MLSVAIFEKYCQFTCIPSVTVTAILSLEHDPFNVLWVIFFGFFDFCLDIDYGYLLNVWFVCSGLVDLINKLQQTDSKTQNTSLDMNPAGVSRPRVAFAFQSKMLKGYQELLIALLTNEHFTHYIQALLSTRTEPVRLALTDKFVGSADKCLGFLHQCSVSFSHQHDAYHSQTSVLSSCHFS